MIRQGGLMGRRTFIFSSALAVGAVPGLVRAASANEKLNIGIIGTGGRGASNLGNVQAGNNIVALCDLNRDALAAGHPAL
ncbi:MAG: hypothetical protein WD079_04145, partial [Phycisphaeraceae bacterium]